MRKKIGTMIAVTHPEMKGYAYLTGKGTLCSKSTMAMTYHASRKVLDTIVAQTEVKYPGFTVSKVERWIAE